MSAPVVVDASAIVDLLTGSNLAAAVSAGIRGHVLHAPAHLDAEVLSALGRLHRAGKLSADDVAERVDRLAAAPLERHELAGLLPGTWRRRHNLRLVDALYVELAGQLDGRLITTDAGMAAASPRATLVG
ncbi:MAG: type II toxin-antitoxin system VapC family toxin [Actinomycetota bacterium]|nr:type II toxin-antitoxin system VapC family toxin [Actinomycetota bacterium]